MGGIILGVGSLLCLAIWAIWMSEGYDFSDFLRKVAFPMVILGLIIYSYYEPSGLVTTLISIGFIGYALDRSFDE